MEEELVEKVFMAIEAGDIETADRYLSEIRMSGDPETEYAVAGIGMEYSLLSPQQCAEWIELAAEGGLEEAQYDIGRRYLDGFGVTRSDEKAVFWLSKSAEQGNCEAEAIVAMMYRRGQGAPKDEDRAVGMLLEVAGCAAAEAKY